MAGLGTSLLGVAAGCSTATTDDAAPGSTPTSAPRNPVTPNEVAPTDSLTSAPTATPAEQTELFAGPTETPRPPGAVIMKHTGLMQSDATGIIYVVGDDLSLQWWQHRPAALTPQEVALVWDDASGAGIGSGWNFRSITSLGFGILLGLDDEGDVFWYRDLARSGEPTWAAQTGRQIGSGWSAEHLVGLSDGYVLAYEPTGEVIWHQWRSAGWQPGSGTTVVDTYDDIATVFPGGGGLVYSIDGSGRLRGSVYNIGSNPNASTAFELVESQRLAGDWGDYVDVVSTGNGVLYALRGDGAIEFHQHSLEGVWTTESGSIVQRGLEAIAMVASDPVALARRELPPIDAYWSDQSMTAGRAASLAVSTVGETVELALHKITFDPATQLIVDERVGETQTLPGRNQGLQPFAWRDGCEWSVDDVDVPAGLASGLYGAVIESEGSARRVVPLIVRPSAPQHRIAVLANTNTWCAYNAWCGINQYTDPNGVELSFAKPNANADVAAQMSNDEVIFDHHLVAAELEIHGWLASEGFDFDLYSDHDFDVGIAGVDSYDVLVLAAHPEYWTDKMYDRLVSYLAGGGSILYLGGNGLYERVEYSQDASALVLRRGNPSGPRDLLRTGGRSERAVLGVAYEGIAYPDDPPGLQRGNAFGVHAPYEVVADDHPFFAGTDLANGDAFVTVDGVTGGAGWELDTSFDDGKTLSAGPAPTNAVLLARGMLGQRPGEQGQWTPDHNAHMVTYDHPGGGMVFSVGSIVFGHWLIQDPRAQTVIRNALQAALA